MPKCLEVLSIIYFREIRNNNLKMFNDDQFKELNNLLENFTKGIPREERICLEEFKDYFPQKVRNLIQNFVSIIAKTRLFVENVLPEKFKNLELPKSDSITIDKIRLKV